jgi:predicted lactoylglutathione lyase
MTMSKMIFLNLPVKDLQAAKAFYEAIGAVNNPQFTDETAACMVFSETIHVMLLTYDKFAQFPDKTIADAHATSQVLLCISVDSRVGVDEIASKALAASGREPRDPQDYGFMYSRTFEDPDGHTWEPMYMDMDAFTAAAAQAQPETTDA